MPSGTAFAGDIVRRPCTSLGVRIMSFLKEESGGPLKKHWNLVLEKRFEKTLSLVSRWTRALVGASENFSYIGQNFGSDVTWNLHGCYSVGNIKETALLDLGNWRWRVSPRRQGSPSVELLIDSALSLLINLEAAGQGRSVLFSDEQKLLFKGLKKGFVKNTKLNFMRC